MTFDIQQLQQVVSEGNLSDEDFQNLVKELAAARLQSSRPTGEELEALQEALQELETREHEVKMEKKRRIDRIRETYNEMLSEIREDIRDIKLQLKSADVIDKKASQAAARAARAVNGATSGCSRKGGNDVWFRSATLFLASGDERTYSIGSASSPPSRLANDLLGLSVSQVWTEVSQHLPKGENADEQVVEYLPPEGTHWKGEPDKPQVIRVELTNWGSV